MERSTRTRLTLALAALVLAPAAAPAQAVTTTQDRALARLQARLAANPTNVKALRAVGLKLYELQRYQESRAPLDQARQLDPRDGVSALYAGLAAEKVNDLTSAKQAYTTYLEVGRTAKVKRDIQARLVAIAKEELRQAARSAVANEQQLRGQSVPGTTVAVLPFRCSCADTSLLPLERGMAELVVTDLSRAGGLRVLERDRMQAIADEIRLSSTTQVDAATATRAGKLIQAGTILNGTINAPSAQSLNLVGALVNTNDASITGNPAAAGTLDALFDAERRFVLSTFQTLNVTLTAAELALFQQRRAPNLQAFLAYSRGLMAEDAGRLDDAVRFFESARSLDPGFTQALQRAQTAAQAQTGAQVTSTRVEQGLRNTAEGQVVAAASTGSTSDLTINATLANVVGDVNPTTTNTVQNNTNTSGGTGGNTNTPQTQNQVAQTTGSNQPATRTGQVTIVIKKP
jgi:tetratricopeptide (TPR) repeat protein